MVGYAAYAEKLQWTPQQVDQLTVRQDDWLMPILKAMDDEREYRERKASEASQRKDKANRARMGLR